VTKDTEYRTLDDLSLRQLAESDPQGFIKHTKKTLIIDEVQRVPALLSAIKMVVDEDSRPGQYLLTGSANIQALPGVQESLAGRIRNLRLRSLSQGELSGTAPAFIERALRLDFPTADGPAYDRQSILEMAFRGGYPEALSLSERERKTWHRDYTDALLESDLRDIARINRHDAMHELINVVAAWSSKYIDLAVMAVKLNNFAVNYF
jgi:predicted AAA+ superfamily ATPase